MYILEQLQPFAGLLQPFAAVHGEEASALHGEEAGLCRLPLPAGKGATPERTTCFNSNVSLGIACKPFRRAERAFFRAPECAKH